MQSSHTVEFDTFAELSKQESGMMKHNQRQKQYSDCGAGKCFVHRSTSNVFIDVPDARNRLEMAHACNDTGYGTGASSPGYVFRFSTKAVVTRLAQVRVVLIARLSLASVDSHGRHVEAVIHVSDVVVYVPDDLQSNNGGS